MTILPLETKSKNASEIAQEVKSDLCYDKVILISDSKNKMLFLAIQENHKEKIKLTLDYFDSLENIYLWEMLIH